MDIQEAAREIADLRGQLFMLRNALGTDDPGQAVQVFKKMIAAVKDLETRVAALEAWALTVTPPGP